VRVTFEAVETGGYDLTLSLRSFMLHINPEIDFAARLWTDGANEPNSFGFSLPDASMIFLSLLGEHLPEKLRGHKLFAM
jgi:hypothetical protein